MSCSFTTTQQSPDSWRIGETQHKQKVKAGAGAQLAECWPSKHQVLCFIPRTAYSEPGVTGWCFQHLENGVGDLVM